MTTASNDVSSAGPGAPASSRRRTVVVVVLVALAGAGVVVALNFKPWILWPTWVNGAYKTEYRDRIASEQDPAIIPLLVAGFRDGEMADETRITLGNLLIDKKNRASEVESALKDPAFDVRRVALRVLARRDYFRKQYAEDPSYGVDRTLLQWLGDPAAKWRNIAIEIVPVVWSPPTAPKEALEALLAILKSPAGSGSDEAASLRGNAAGKLQAYHDCASGAAILAAATAEPHANARMREMQAVVQMYDATEKACDAQLPEDAVRGLVESCFKHEGTSEADKGQRIGAMQILERHPSWAERNADALRALLALPSGAGRDVERRHALDALVAAKDEATLKVFPRYFHDAYPGTRSSAVQSVVYGRGGLEAKHFESCLVGYVRMEPAAAPNQVFASRFALQKLRMFAPEWLGFPARARTLGPALGPEVEAVMAAIFQDKEIAGVTRASVSEAWWEWLAKRNGLETPEQIEAGRKARDAFWDKAKAADVTGAKAVLDGAPAKGSPLWGYEWGWVASRG